MFCRRFCLILLISLGCSSPFAQVDRHKLPTAEAGDARALVVEDRVLVRFQPGTGPVPFADVTHQKRAIYLREGGESLFKVVGLTLPGMVEVTEFAVQTTSPNGEVRRYGRSDAADLPALGEHTLYSDARALVVRAGPAQNGCVIDSRVTERHLDVRVFHASQDFGDEFEVDKASLEVIAPLGWEIEHVTLAAGLTETWAPEMFVVDGEQHWLWQRAHLPAQKTEPLGPPLPELAPKLHVRLSAWRKGDQREPVLPTPEALSAWSWTKMPAAKHPDIAQLAAEIVQNSPPDALEKARRIHAWVRDHIQYCAIAIGEGGWIPHEAHAVAKLRYGDCKDKANLLHWLLQEVGVQSRLVTIFAHAGLPHPYLLNTLAGNFNHMILQVDLPNGPVLVDPTSRTTSLGELPPSDEGAPYLLLTETGAALAETQRSPMTQNTVELTEDLQRLGTQMTGGTFSAVLTGHFAGRAWHILLDQPQEQWAEPLGTQLLRLPAGEVTTLAATPLMPGNQPQPVTLTGKLRARDKPLQTGVVLVSDLAGSWGQNLPDRQRKQPIILGFLRRVHERIRLHMRAHVSANQPLPQTQLSTPFADFALKVSARPDGLELERTLTYKQAVVAAQDYAAVRGFFAAILKAEQGSIWLEGE